MEANTIFEVLKSVQAIKSTKGDSEIIFKDLKGKIYFVDKRNIEGYEDVREGELYTAWVIKDFEKVGYIKLTLNNMFISDFIGNLPKLDLEYYKSFILDKGNKDNVRLSNAMYNCDESFRAYLERDDFFEPLPTEIEVKRHLVEVSYDSERPEFVHDLVTLHTYLYRTFHIEFK